ncbi:MAG: hypothetical protein KDH09_09240 [Chrysiogenetes bacterium]|nr:hypothetical protein [Chrysiogenetes bacterium]
MNFWHKLARAALVLGALALSVPGTAAAASSYKNREGKIQVGAGIGMSASPFDLTGGIEAQFFPANSVSIGPRLSFIPAERGPADSFNEDIYLLMLDLRFHPPMGEKLSRLKPFIGIGAGISFIDYSLPVFGSHVDISPAVEFGAGLNYFVADTVSLGTQAHVILPLGSSYRGVEEDAVLEWQIVHFDFLF